MNHMNIRIIGLGGIGSVLADNISRFLNYKPPAPIINITLVDGDKYEPKNLERQQFQDFGNKSEIKKGELQRKFENIVFNNYPRFINKDTINDVIMNGDIVLMCVDNHKTRKLVSDYCSELIDVVLISGGNELEDGNVQVFVKKNGEKITPNLADYHKELQNPDDKSPDELSCEELAISQPQLYFTNVMAAAWMCSAFYNNIIKEDHKFSEVYFDIGTMKADSKIRKVKN